MREAVIVDAVRTPLGRGKENGALHGWHPVDLASETLRALVERTGIDPAEIEDVIMGCVGQVGEQGVNIGRNAALAAGFPESVCGTSVDRQCGSSQQALHFAAQGVIAGAYDAVIAAGVESMSRVPMGTSAAVGGAPFGPRMIERYTTENLYGAGGLVNQGLSAEIIAARWQLVAARARRVLARLASEGRRGDPQRLVRERDRPDRRRACRRCARADPHRRRHPPRDDDREARLAEAGVQARRRDHRRQLEPDHRRRRGGAGDGEGRRPAPSACGRAPASTALRSAGSTR